MIEPVVGIRFFEHAHNLVDGTCQPWIVDDTLLLLLLLLLLLQLPALAGSSASPFQRRN